MKKLTVPVFVDRAAATIAGQAQWGPTEVAVADLVAAGATEADLAEAALIRDEDQALGRSTVVRAPCGRSDYVYDAPLALITPPVVLAAIRARTEAREATVARLEAAEARRLAALAEKERQYEAWISELAGRPGRDLCAGSGENCYVLDSQDGERIPWDRRRDLDRARASAEAYRDGVVDAARKVRLLAEEKARTQFERAALLLLPDDPTVPARLAEGLRGKSEVEDAFRARMLKASGLFEAARLTVDDIEGDDDACPDGCREIQVRSDPVAAADREEYEALVMCRESLRVAVESLGLRSHEEATASARLLTQRADCTVEQCDAYHSRRVVECRVEALGLVAAWKVRV